MRQLGALLVFSIALVVVGIAAADPPKPRCVESVCTNGICKCVSAPIKREQPDPHPHAVMPKPMLRKMAALGAPPTRGATLIDPDNAVTVVRRRPEGGVLGALHLKPTGEWDKAISNAPPNIVRDLAELTAYLDQVVASAP